MSGTFTAAVVQAAPVAFRPMATLSKAVELAGRARAAGADLAVFPEAFLSTYPRGLDFGAVVGSRSEAGRDMFLRYWESAIDVPGPITDEMGFPWRWRGCDPGVSTAVSNHTSTVRTPIAIVANIASIRLGGGQTATTPASASRAESRSFMSRESGVRSTTSPWRSVAFATATAIEASIRSEVPARPQSRPDARAADPSSGTSSQRFRERDRTTCRFGSLQA